MVGTIFFIFVFMLALGSMAYESGLQAQASQAEQQAQAVAARRMGESVVFQQGGTGLAAKDAGGYSVGVNHLILKFPNGTVYALPVSSVLSAGAALPVRPLVPAGVCSPGSATCLSKYDQLVSGDPPGGAVGLLTSMGNVFWFSGAGSAGGKTEVKLLASGTWTVPAGVTSVYVICVGGGGGGGGGGGSTDGGGPAGNG